MFWVENGVWNRSEKTGQHYLSGIFMAGFRPTKVNVPQKKNTKQVFVKFL